MVVYCRTQFLLYPKQELLLSIFEQINTYYTAEYFTECILSEIQKENKINILNNKHVQLNNKQI